MATRTLTKTDHLNGFRNVSKTVWAGLLQSSADVGSALEMPDALRHTFQLSGTLGTGGAVPLEGSNDGTTWGALRDAAGNAVTLNAIGMIWSTADAPQYIRPGTTAGDGTTNLTLTVVSRRLT